jgi:hypothetical protein
MNTAIINFLPQLKQHHVVLLENNNDVYSIDFTPVEDNQRNQRLIKLLLGKNVKAAIRIRYIKNSTLWEEEKIIKTIWNKTLDENESRALTNSIYNSIKDEEIKDFVDKLLQWKLDKNQTMNLYTRNCQHFSGYAKEKFYTYLE